MPVTGGVAIERLAMGVVPAGVAAVGGRGVGLLERMSGDSVPETDGFAVTSGVCVRGGTVGVAGVTAGV